MEGDNIFRYRNMDIKLGGREMATVVYSNEEDDMYNMTIGNIKSAYLSYKLDLR